MSASSIALVLAVRKDSARVPNKMLRPFADSCLFKIALDKLKAVSEELEYTDVYVAAYEEEFIREASGTKLISRSYESAHAEGPVNVLGFLRGLSEDWVVLVNACCPMISVETLHSFLMRVRCRQDDETFHGLTTVQMCRRWVWSDKGVIVNEDPEVSSTREMKPLYLASNGLYAFRKSYFFSHGRYWEYREGSPSLMVVPAVEAMDIDTIEEFQIAELVYKGLQ